jgi:metal-sulfur cluster biosynthetic enzyme
MSGVRHAARLAEVHARLGQVTDPELDEPVTDLGFITSVTVDPAGAVAIGFRLPTYWCAANFAFLMADDMRRAVATLPWATSVRVTLGEHMYAETINRGLADARSFADSFGDAAEGDLETLRRTFAVKAFQRRQEALLRHLLAAGIAPATLSLPALRALALDAEGAGLRARYLERRELAGPGELAFVTAAGAPLDAVALPAYLTALRRVGINAEFNGALCRGLLAARFPEAGSDAGCGEPTLLDFARMPARPAVA